MINLYLLGSFELQINGKATRLPTRKMESLLAYLVLHPAPQSREKLAAMFWGDSSDELARRSLRTALAALRKELGDHLIIADRETVQRNPAFAVWIDVEEMERQAKEVLSADFPINCELEIELYRGDLLEEFYEEWILEEREQCRSLWIDALLRYAQTQRTNGEYRRAIEISQKAISMDRANERAYQHLIFCYTALGDRSAAWKSYEECAKQLQEKLGIRPSKDTEDLFGHVKQLNASGISPGLAKSNLPIPLTSFIGREQELNTLRDLFAKTRLLTLTGVGGCGKTRLAIQFAGQLIDEHPDGVWWIELASIQDENLLPQVIKRTLGIADSTKDSAEESIFKFLQNRQALLVLDNCEHVISACANLAENILSRCQLVKMLATSREALSVPSEIAWLVPSLSLPPSDQLDDILKWECPRLFLERATSYRPDLQLTETNVQALSQICHALEGIPLAVELAAARVKALSLEQLASRLDDKLSLLTSGSRTAQPRQQTLRAAIDWSYELLSEFEQIALQRLSILNGTWTLEAAVSIAGLNDLTPGKELDLITRLIDKSLLVAEPYAEEIRYRMLEIIRQYAAEKLRQANELNNVQHRHLLYYTEQTHQARHLWYTGEHARLMKRFDADYPNLQVALAWGLENPQRSIDWQDGLHLAVDMGPLWNFLGEYNQGTRWLQNALDQVNAVLAGYGLGSEERAELLSIKAMALYEYGFLIWFQSQYAASRAIFLESSEIFAEINDAAGLAYSNMFLAHSTWLQGQQEEAREMWAQSLEQFDRSGDLWGAGMVHSFIGRAERESNHFREAEQEYDQCLVLFQEVDDGWGMGIALSHKGMIAFQQNRLEEAQKLFEQRLIISREHGFRQSAAYSIFLLGTVAWKLNNPVEVRRQMHEAFARFYRLGNYVTTTDALVGLAWAEAELGYLEQAAFLLGVIEKADQTLKGKVSFEETYFHQPIVKDLQSRKNIQILKDALERGRNSNFDQVVKEILQDE
jgi:predicted ATPase/DNA-binding SARP family transcriptional activator